MLFYRASEYIGTVKSRDQLASTDAISLITDCVVDDTITMAFDDERGLLAKKVTNGETKR